MRTLFTVMLATTVVTTPSLADHQSWIICPVDIATLIVNAIEKDEDPEATQAAVKRWCYDLTMPHTLIDHPNPEAPVWHIPYEATGWVAFEIENQ